MYFAEDWFLEQELAQDTLLIWQELANLMAELCHTPAGFIVQMTKNGYQVVIANKSSENPYPAGVTLPTETNIFCRKVVEENKPLYVNNATQREEWQSNPEVSDDNFNSYLGFPLYWPNGNVFGTICVMDFKITNYDNRYHRLLKHFKEMVERELKLLEKNLTIEHLSIHDELTGLLNRRGLSSKISQHLKNANRHKEDIAVCYYDLDELKKINDTQGHQKGDDTIKVFAKSLENSLRKTDITVRCGGDEFIAIITLSHANELTIINDRLKSNIAKSNKNFAINYSLGTVVLEYKELLNTNIETVISQADKLMYKNKQSKLSN